jgi:hypothetical protein
LTINGSYEPRQQLQVSLLALGARDFPATIVAAGANVVAQVHLTGSRFDSKRRVGQKVVRTTHTTLGRRLFVLLNGHVYYS